MPRAARLAIVLALAACGSEGPVPMDCAATWRSDSLPLVVIADAPEDSVALIGNAIGASAIGDSQLVVVDRGYLRLSYFDLDGQLVRTSGREGDGPGEFRYLSRFSRCGDSLVVQDIERDIWFIIGLDGVVGRSYKPETPPNARFNSPYVSACNRDGAFVYGGWESLPPTDKPIRARGDVPYWLTDRDGKVTATLGEWPGSERLLTPGGSGPHPLGKQPVIAIGRDRVYLGTADSFAIQTFHFDGTPGATVVKPGVELATTPADIAFARLMDTLGKSAEDRDWEIRQWEQFEYPPTVPAYTALLIDRDDNLWVRTFPRGDANLVRWVVFDPEGREIGSIDLAATLTVYDIGADWLVGVEVALADGAQRVVKYRLQR